jgi:ribosome biogenesis GTPase
VLLNKIDIAADPEDLSSACGELRLASPGVPVIPVSARRGDGLAELARYLAPGLTIVLLGASGVGKSTLLNRLIEHKAQPVREVSGLGDRGRHTTTAREMFCLLSGALLVDTPGLREVGLLGDRQGLSRAFEDIAALAVSCRFRDCRHEHEPGCAVRGAAEAGSLDSVRYSAYLKLVREAAHAETEADALARQRRRLQEKSLAKRLRQRLKEKGYE